MTEIRDNEFNLLKTYLNRICGIEVPPEKRYLFKTRLADFMAQEGFANFSALYQALNSSNDPTLERHLIQAMTTHESSFFRDRHPFELFVRKLLPETAQRRVETTRFGPPRIRLLSAGCSIGQEPYSLAMCVRDWIDSGTAAPFSLEDIQIHGIDVSASAIRRATKAVYSAQEIGRSMPREARRKYLTEVEDGWQVVPEIRQMVTFADVNLARTFSYLGKFDMIFCRNVLIYFSADVKKSVLEQFHKMLRPDGYLLLGASESLYNVTKKFTAVHHKATVYYVPEPCTD